MQAVQDFVTIADAPAGQAHFDVGHVGLVVAVAIRHEQQVGRRADEDAVEADGERRRKDDAFHEDLAAVGDAVAVGVFEDQDAAVAGVRESAAARLVVEVLRHPEPPAIVPAERHRLLDHRLGGPRVDRVAGDHRHRRRRLIGREERFVASFALRDAPERFREVGRPVAAVLAPRLRHLDVVERAGVDDEAMADDFGLAGLDGPVGQARPRRADAELTVDAPGLGIAGVVGMVEDRDVREIAAALDLHPDVDPHRALTLGALVALARGVDDLARMPSRHGMRRNRPP